MGLDVVTNCNLIGVAAEDVPRDEGGDIQEFDTYASAYLIEGFERQFEGLRNGGFYLYKPGPCFRAGSYIFYNKWREHLAKLAGYPPSIFAGPDHAHSEGAWREGKGLFIDLIDFPDCEGCIGPTACQRLADDFREWSDRAKEFSKKLGDEDWFYGLYADFKNAFEKAAGNGMVRFC